jgi:hypothetical protein
LRGFLLFFFFLRHGVLGCVWGLGIGRVDKALEGYYDTMGRNLELDFLKHMRYHLGERRVELFCGTDCFTSVFLFGPLLSWMEGNK